MMRQTNAGGRGRENYVYAIYEGRLIRNPQPISLFHHAAPKGLSSHHSPLMAPQHDVSLTNSTILLLGHDGRVLHVDGVTR